MSEIFNNAVENIATDSMIDISLKIATKSKYGFCRNKKDNLKLIVSCICFNCMENKVIFSDEQINNINHILNNI